MEKIEMLKSFLFSTPDDPFLRHALALEYIKAGNEAEARILFLEYLHGILHILELIIISHVYWNGREKMKMQNNGMRKECSQQNRQATGMHTMN